MGFIHTKSGDLCCDFCGAHGGVKKIACPFGWCQAYAFCQSCERKYAPTGKAYRERHRNAGCEQASKRFATEQAQCEAILESGAWLRKAAVGQDGAVKVWFGHKDGNTMEMMMAKETYRAIPLGTPATLEDYREIGTVTPIEV